MVIVAVLFGAGLGALLGYVDARPWAWKPSLEDDLSAGPSGAGGPSNPAGSASRTVPKALDLVVDEPIYHFDKMEVGTHQIHAFQLKNQSSREQTVKVVSITCQCTGLQIAGKRVEPGDFHTIAPGASVAVELEWEAKEPPRPFRHGATLSASGAAPSRISLEVEGEIVASTVLNPQRLMFSSVKAGESKSAEVAVTSFVDPNVEVLSHQVSDAELAERMRVDIVPLTDEELAVSGARSGVKIVAAIDPQRSLGPFSGRLHVTTNLERAAQLSIPISGNVVGDISVYGTGWLQRTGLLKLGAIRSAEGKQVKLTLAVRGERSAETTLELASIDPPELQVALGEPRQVGKLQTHIPLTITAPPGMQPMVRMEAPPGAEPIIRTNKWSRGEGSLVLTTNLPDTPEVKMRLSLTVQP